MKYTGDINDILKALAHIKIDHNITNTDIANNTGKSKQTISNIFNGRQPNLTLNSLLALCDAMNCELYIDFVPKSKTDNKEDPSSL